MFFRILESFQPLFRDSQQLCSIDDLDAVSQRGNSLFLSQQLHVQPLDGVKSQKIIFEEIGDILGQPDG